MPGLRMSFTGLCAFVPKNKIDENTPRKKTQVRVLLAEGVFPLEEQEGRQEQHEHQHQHEPHLPVLVCRRDQVDGNGRQPDETFPDPDEDGLHWAVFYLDDQDLCLPAARPDELTIETNGGGKDCPNETNMKSFSWVGDLEKISPKAGKVKKECLDMDPKKIPDFVIGRVQLWDGRLETLSLAQDELEHTSLWEFKEPGKPKEAHEQALADSVMYHYNHGAPGDVLELKTRLFKKPVDRGLPGPTPQKKRSDHILDLYPQGVGSELSILLKPVQGVVDAAVKNMPEKDYERTREPENDDVDEHYAHFYKISDVHQPKKNVPHRYDACHKVQVDPSSKNRSSDVAASRLLAHLGNPSCPPTRTKENSAA